MIPCAYIFDIDGTLADCSQRLHFIQQEKRDWDNFYNAMVNDKPIPDVQGVLFRLSDSGAKILFVTGRPEKYRKQTVEWLKRFTVINLDDIDKFLYMRKDGDHREDYIVKREIYENMIKDNFYIYGVFEDREQCVNMWRDKGLTCFQVSNGKY